MKKIILILIIALSQTALFAQCPQGDLTIFSSQTDIDNFPIIYPNCTEVEGGITITGGNITNLYGLSGITSIGGDLNILYTVMLPNLTGMDGLEHIGGSLTVIENYTMTSLYGISNLETVDGDIVVSQNQNMNSLTGLSSLTTIGNGLYIGLHAKLSSFSSMENLSTIGHNMEIIENPKLESIGQLQNLTSIGGDVFIRKNDSLSSLAGLAGLTTIGGSLTIKSNTTLTSIADLGLLTSIGGELVIQSNYDLPSLAGLDNIDAASISSLSIYSNTSLSSCEVLSICNYLVSPGGNILISNNATGCNSQAEVEEACEWVSINEFDQQNDLSLYPNPANTSITIETAQSSSPDAWLNISNTSGQSLIKQELTKDKTNIDIRQLLPGIYIVNIWTGNESVTKKLVVN